VDPGSQLSSHLGFMDAARAQTGDPYLGCPTQTVPGRIHRPVEAPDQGLARLTSEVRVDLPWSYTLPATSVQILAGIITAAIRTRDRPPEVA
jgi:hypothetical protein